MKIFFVSLRVEKFFKSIQKEIRLELVKGFDFLSYYGHNLKMPFSKALGGGLFELRIIDEVHVRFIYTFHAGNIYILHGFFKKTDKISKKDMNYAKKQKKLLR